MERYCTRSNRPDFKEMLTSAFHPLNVTVSSGTHGSYYKEYCIVLNNKRQAGDFHAIVIDLNNTSNMIRSIYEQDLGSLDKYYTELKLLKRPDDQYAMSMDDQIKLFETREDLLATMPLAGLHTKRRPRKAAPFGYMAPPGIGVGGGGDDDDDDEGSGDDGGGDDDEGGGDDGGEGEVQYPDDDDDEGGLGGGGLGGGSGGGGGDEMLGFEEEDESVGEEEYIVEETVKPGRKGKKEKRVGRKEIKEPPFEPLPDFSLLTLSEEYLPLRYILPAYEEWNILLRACQSNFQYGEYLDHVSNATISLIADASAGALQRGMLMDRFVKSATSFIKYAAKREI